MMIKLLEIKENIKSLYIKFGTYIDIIVKFAVALTALLLINKNIGYMERLGNPFLIVLISLVCSVIPYGLTAVVLSICVLANVYTVSKEMALIIAILLLVIALLYYSFHPSDAHILILTPVLLALKLPFAVPMIAGLSAGITCVVPISFGIVLYYILSFIKNNPGLLTNESDIEITDRYAQLLKGIVTNKIMWYMIIICALTVLIVFLIRVLPVNYSWYIAIAAGMIVLVAGVYVGNSIFDLGIETGKTITAIILSGLLALVYSLFAFNLDYARIERSQFEDDNYYYYVKAVPKMTVSTSDKQVRKFNSSNRKSGREEN